MSLEHHGQQDDLVRRFIEQKSGQYARSFPNGRIGADDDGQLTYAIATDMNHKIIRIVFPHPTKWIALDAESAEKLRDELTKRLFELRGITV